MLLAHFFGTN